MGHGFFSLAAPENNATDAFLCISTREPSNGPVSEMLANWWLHPQFFSKKITNVLYFLLNLLPLKTTIFSPKTNLEKSTSNQMFSMSTSWMLAQTTEALHPPYWPFGSFRPQRCGDQLCFLDRRFEVFGDQVCCEKKWWGWKRVRYSWQLVFLEFFLVNECETSLQKDVMPERSVFFFPTSAFPMQNKTIRDVSWSTGLKTGMGWRAPKIPWLHNQDFECAVPFPLICVGVGQPLQAFTNSYINLPEKTIGVSSICWRQLSVQLFGSF